MERNPKLAEVVWRIRDRAGPPGNINWNLRTDSPRFWTRRFWFWNFFGFGNDNMRLTVNIFDSSYFILNLEEVVRFRSY